MGDSLRDKIRAADDRGRALVHIPEWGVDVYVAVMSGKALDDYESSFFSRDGEVLDPREAARNGRARLAVLCACDEDGNPIFTRDDIEWLGDKSGAALDRISARAIELNRLNADAKALAKN